MAKPQVSKEELRAMAGLSGLELSDERLDDLLPQVRQAAEGLEGLDALDLESIDPALVFKVDRE